MYPFPASLIPLKFSEYQGKGGSITTPNSVGVCGTGGF